jgi:hypothetical protein
MFNELLLFIIIFGFIFHLILWNLKVAYPVYAWSNDAKNVRSLLAALKCPEHFKNDFPFKYAAQFAYYMPLFTGFMLWLEKKLHTFEKAVVFLNMIMATLYVSGVSLYLFMRYGHSLFILFCLFLAIPYVMVVEDGLSAGLPRLWTPRALANAFTAYFILFLWMTENNIFFLLPAAILSGFIFNIHPRNGVATAVMVVIAVILNYQAGHLALSRVTLLILMNFLLCIPYLLVYFKYSTPFNSDLSAQDLRIYQKEAAQRIPLWPTITPSFWGRLWRAKGQLVLGSAYLIGSAFILWRFGPMAGLSGYIIQSFFNLLLLSALIAKGEYFGLVLINLALLGLLQLPATYPLIAFFMALISFYFYFRYQKYLFPVTLILFFSALILYLNNRPIFSYQPALFDLIFLWLTPCLFFLYLTYGAVFNWLLPFVLNRRGIMKSDICHIAKSAFWQVYFLAFYGVFLLGQNLRQVSPENIAAFISLAAFFFLYYKFYKDFHPINEPADEWIIYEWIKEHITQPAVFHIVSDLPPLHFLDKKESSSFAFRFRANTLMPITGSYKDGGLAGYTSPALFKEWMNRMADIQQSIRHCDLRQMIAHAVKYGANYLIVSNNLLPPNFHGISDSALDPNPLIDRSLCPGIDPVMFFKKYTLLKLLLKG